MDNDWYNFMQSKPVRIVFNSMCAVICAFYAVGAVGDVLRPDDSAHMLMESMGQTGFYALTAARFVVCVWVAITFVRMTIKTIRGDDGE